MEFIILFSLHILAAMVLTAGGCWLALKWRRRPAWYIGVLVAFVVTAFEELYPDGGFVFHPERLAPMKTNSFEVFEGFLIVLGVAAIPALLVVHYFRKGRNKYGERDIQGSCGLGEETAPKRAKVGAVGLLKAVVWTYISLGVVIIIVTAGACYGWVPFSSDGVQSSDLFGVMEKVLLAWGIILLPFLKIALFYIGRKGAK